MDEGTGRCHCRDRLSCQQNRLGCDMLRRTNNHQGFGAAAANFQREDDEAAFASDLNIPPPPLLRLHVAGKQLEGTASASHRQRQRSNPSCSTSQTWVALGRSRQLVTAMLVTGLPGSRMIVWFPTCYIIMVMQ